MQGAPERGKVAGARIVGFRYVAHTFELGQRVEAVLAGVAGEASAAVLDLHSWFLVTVWRAFLRHETKSGQIFSQTVIARSVVGCRTVVCGTVC